MKIFKRLKNCLHGYETTKKRLIVTFCIVFYGKEMTLIHFNLNEFSILFLKKWFIPKYSIYKKRTTNTLKVLKIVMNKEKKNWTYSVSILQHVGH
jgi:hypothetical protein